MKIIFYWIPNIQKKKEMKKENVGLNALAISSRVGAKVN